MAEELALARAIIQVEGDATQLVAAMASGEKALNDFTAASKQNIATAVAALAGLGDEAAKAFLTLSRSSQSTVRNLAVETGRINAELGKISQQEFRTLESIVRGTSATISNQFVGALSNAKDALTEFKNAQQQAAAGTAFLDSLRSKIDALGKSQTDLLRIQSAGFGLDVAAQAKPLIDSLERYERVVNRIKEAERAAAADKSFINSLKAQDEALRQSIATFNKAQSEVLAYQAAQRGGAVAQNAAPIIASIKAQEQQLKELQATEERVASNNAFIAGLERRVQAINKTQAELLELELAQRKGLSAEDTARASQFITLLKQQEQEQRKLTGATTGYDAAARNARVSANQLRTAYAQLPAQITDVVTSLASGIPAYLVLIQQGGQIKDAFGGIGNAARALVGLLTPLRVAIGGTAAVLTTLAIAYFQGRKESDEFRKAIVLSGNAAGTTVGQLAALSDSVGTLVSTQGKAAAVIAQIASTGKVSASAIGLVAEAVIRLEKVAGIEVDKTVEQFAKLAKEPTKAVAALNESTNFLTIELYRQIKALEDNGRSAEAATVAQTAYAEIVIQRSKDLESQLGLLERAWNGVGEAARGAWDKLLNVGRPDNLEERIAAAGRTLERLRTQPGQQQIIEQAAGGNVQPIATNEVEIAAEAQNLEDLRETQRLINRNLSLRQEQTNQVKALIAAEEELAKLSGESLTKEDKLRQKILRVRQLAKDALWDEAQTQELVNKIAAEYYDSLAKGRAGKKQIDETQKAYENLARTLRDELIASTVDLQVAQQGLTAEQAAYLKIVSSPIWNEFTEGQRIAITRFYEQIVPLKELTKAELDRKKAVEESNKAIAKATEDQAKRASDLALSNEALEDEIENIGKTKEALAQLEAQRLRNNAASLEAFAISEQLRGASDEYVAALRREASELERRSGLVLQRAGAQAADEVKKANEKAAKDAYERWQDTVNNIGQGLAEALIDGGKSAARFIQRLFNDLVLRPAVQAVLTPIIQAIGGAFGLGGGAIAGVGGAGGAGGGINAFQLASFANSVNTLGASFKAFGTNVASFGSYVSTYSGATYNTGFGTQQSAMLAQQEAGLLTSSTSQAWASAIGTAAAGIAGVYTGRAISGGFAGPGSDTGNAYVNAGTVAGAAIGAYFGAPEIGAFLGGVVGGFVNRAIGFRPEQLESREIVGQFSEGQFTGELATNLIKEGGWFRKDRRRQLTETITGDLDKALDEAGLEVIKIVKTYGEALSLPVDDLVKIPAQIKVKLTENAEENQKAIDEALQQYAEVLFESFADELEPLRRAGETIAQTIERVGGSLIVINDILKVIDVAALDLNVSGGQAAVALTELFGGLQQLSNATTEYYQRFFSESERVSNATRAINEVFGDLGLTVPTTKQQFRDLVSAQDLTTESGRNAFTALIGISTAFDEISTAAAEVAKNLRRALEALRERFRTPEQTRVAATQDIAAQVIDLGVLRGSVQEITRVLTNATKEEVLDFVEGFSELANVSSETKVQIAELAAQLVDLKIATTDALDEATRAVSTRFQTPEQRRLQPFIDIQQNLADVGLEISLEDILGASKQDILDFANAILESADTAIETKNVVLEAADALGELSDEASQFTLDSLLEQIGDITVLEERTKTLSDQYLETVASIEELETGLAQLTATVDQSIQEILQSLLDTQRGLKEFRAGLNEQIEDARLRTLTPEARVAALRQEEARLFAELRTTADPVAIAGQLQKVVISRIKEEANIRATAQNELIANAELQIDLTKQAREAQIDALEAQIDALERLRDLAEDIAQFTASLRFSDISPLNYEDQLNAARQLFETTLNAAKVGDEGAQGNLIGNARAFLDEARAYYASSGAYASIFAEVTGALDALGLTAQEADPQIAALEAQLEALQAFGDVVIDTSAEEVAGLTAVRDALDIRISENTAAITRQIELAEAEIEDRRAERDLQAELIRERAAEARLLQAKIDNIDLNLGRLVQNVELAEAAP